MLEFNTISDLSDDVKKNINKYNEAEQPIKKQAYIELFNYIEKILSSPKNRSLIYKGDELSVVFVKKLGKWRMKIWKDITSKIGKKYD